MSISLVRVVNRQVDPVTGLSFVRSILLDKIDRSQGNFEGYAQNPKQAVYVPYWNPVDPTVRGYVDLVPTDEVRLSMDHGPDVELSILGSTAGINKNTNVNNVLRIRTSPYEAFTTITIGADPALANATVIAQLNQFFQQDLLLVRARLVTTALPPGEAKVELYTIGPNAGSGTHLEIDTVANGSTLNTALGLTPLVDPHVTMMTLADDGTIAGLYKHYYVDVGRVNAGDVQASVLATAVYNGGLTHTTITGTRFLSVYPDLTYVILTNTVTGASQQILATAMMTAITGTPIVVPDASVTIGTPAAGWTAQVLTNSRLSNTVTLT